MASAIRRYKNQISIITKKVESQLKNHALFKLEGYIRSTNRGAKVRVITSDDTYNTYLLYVVMLTNPKLKVVESDDYIFMGIDLDQPAKFLLDSWPTSDESELLNRFLDTILPRWGNPVEPVTSQIKQELVSMGRIESDYPFSRKQDPYSFNRDMILDSKYFKEFVRKVSEIPNYLSVSMSLRKGEFPKCPDRKLFPNLFIDIETGQVNYCIDSQAESYRQGRNSMIISNFISNNRAITDAVIQLQPFKLIDLSPSGGGRYTKAVDPY